MKKHAGQTILSPRITEKGAFLSAHGAYVFNVATSANKQEIGRAVTELYKVTPRKIAIVNTKGKVKVTRGTNRLGQAATEKKAYVYLKPGETIEIA